MGIPKKYKASFFEGECYHVYNRTNNKELLFLDDEDRFQFLNNFQVYTSAFLEIFTWNLLPNHFHFYLRVKNTIGIINFLKKKHSKELCITERKFLKKEVSLHELIDNIFKRFFISYTIYFNKAHNRKGNLFHRPFKHVQTNKEAQFIQTVTYININAIKHHLVKKLEDHKWSAYHLIISEKPTTLLRIELLDWFGGKKQFIKIHRAQIREYHSYPELIDDDL